MNNQDKKMNMKKNFVTPKAEIIFFDAHDALNTSDNESGNAGGGGFYGDWDTNLPEIDF